jgi:hypothetical protein
MTALALLVTTLLAAPKPTEYASPELGFSASFPDVPAVGHAKQALGEEIIPVDTVGVDRGQKETYLVSVTTYPHELVTRLTIADTLKAAQAASVTGVGGTVLKDNATPFAGKLSREYWAKVEGGQMHSRLVMAGDRLYMVLVLFPASRETAAATFFDSFKLVEAAPTAR